MVESRAMDKKWWEKSLFYEIYMPSFCDGNGDGIGDFIGLTSKLDYLKELGVDGLWLTPFYQSPKVDNGYDISDYYEIDRDYGTMDDFDIFIQTAHSKGIKVIADLVLNHTSSEHEWFKESRSSKDSPKRDWYVWKDGHLGSPPNNWESFFGGSAWEYCEQTDQYYYHAFAKEQVDLNWTNPEVKQAMFEMMAFWLNKGMDGFRLDVINFLKVNNLWTNHSYNAKGEQIHQFDKDQDGVIEVIKDISQFVHQFPNKFLVGEVGSEDLDILSNYSGDGKLDVVFNFNIGSIPTFDAAEIIKQLISTEGNYSMDQYPTLFFSSHDMSRHASRFALENTDNEEAISRLIAGLMLTAKGVPFMYYGEEIGMKDGYFDTLSSMKDVQGIMAYHQARDNGKSDAEALELANEKGRDKSRTPMLWNTSHYNGFSKVKPWLYPKTSVAKHPVTTQILDESSMLNYYKQLIKIRRGNLALHSGSYEWIRGEHYHLAFLKKAGKEQVLALFNFSHKSLSYNMAQLVNDKWKFMFSNKRNAIELSKWIELLPYEMLLLSPMEGI